MGCPWVKQHSPISGTTHSPLAAHPIYIQTCQAAKISYRGQSHRVNDLKPHFLIGKKGISTSCMLHRRSTRFDRIPNERGHWAIGCLRCFLFIPGYSSPAIIFFGPRIEGGIYLQALLVIQSLYRYCAHKSHGQREGQGKVTATFRCRCHR